MDKEKRFWDKVDRVKGENVCWEWRAAKDRCGYGKFGLNGKTVYSHRFSWELEHGEIPKGMFILHKCDNPSCVRLSHLFVGTPADNTADMIKKGRQSTGEKHGRLTRGEKNGMFGRTGEKHPMFGRTGEKHPMSKLDNTAIRIIRTLYLDFEFKQIELANLYVVSTTQISDIINRKTWKHIQ